MPKADLPREVAQLLRPDGSVVIPATIAADVLRRLLRDLSGEVRANGGSVSPTVYRILWALHTAAEEGAGQESDPVGSVTGTPAAPGASVEISASELAERIGCSAEYARRLARAGRVPARRVGRTWLIATDETEAA